VWIVGGGIHRKAEFFAQRAIDEISGYRSKPHLGAAQILHDRDMPVALSA
jgi:hypothetical protein